MPIARAPKYVTLQIHKVRCMKTTREIDKDEIFIVAIKTVGKVEQNRGKKIVRGRSLKGKKINAGKFKKGTVARFSKPKTIARFGYGGSKKEWPRSYFATLLLIEKDEGKLGLIVSKAIKRLDKKTVTAISSTVGDAAQAAAAAGAAGVGGAIGSVIPLVGTAVGAAVGTAIGLGIKEIGRARADDVFPPRKTSQKLARPARKTGLIPNSRKEIIFKGFGGRYKVTYSWCIS